MGVKLPRKYKIRPYDCPEEQYLTLYRAYQWADSNKESAAAWTELEDFTALNHRKLCWGYVNSAMDGKLI